MMDEMNDGRGISVILTPGRYNSAYFEHSYLAEKTGATLAYPGDLFVEDNKVYYSGIYKERTRVGCIYRRVSDEYMDPLVFEASSLLGIPNVMQAYKAGNVALVNAIGNGVADDKGIYYFGRLRLCAFEHTATGHQGCQRGRRLRCGIRQGSVGRETRRAESPRHQPAATLDCPGSDRLQGFESIG